MSQLTKHQQNTLRAINKRFANLKPAIDLTEHIKTDDHGNLRRSVRENTLMGIEFAVKDRKKFEDALRGAKNSIGKKAFFSMEMDPNHWGLEASFANTEGTGYREISELQLTTRSSLMADGRPTGRNIPKFDGRFAGQFGANIDIPDMASLHCAVWNTGVKKLESKLSMRPVEETMCSIHIDSAAFVLRDTKNNIVLTPALALHTLNELIFKEKFLTNILKLPDTVVDRIHLDLNYHPTEDNRFSPLISLRGDVLKTDNLKLSVSASCGFLTACRERSVNISFSGSHGIGDGD